MNTVLLKGWGWRALDEEFRIPGTGSAAPTWSSSSRREVSVLQHQLCSADWQPSRTCNAISSRSNDFLVLWSRQDSYQSSETSFIQLLLTELLGSAEHILTWQLVCFCGFPVTIISLYLS